MPSQKEVFYPELKEAILNMPQKEKDKLLLRLLVKDALLVAKLEHELLKDESDTQAIFLKKEADIKRYVGKEDSPGLLLMTFRYINGDITRYEKITKDKLGAIKLTLFMLNSGLSSNMAKLKVTQYEGYTLATYVVARASSILNKLAKTHEDYYIEVEEQVNLMLRHIYEFPQAAKMAQEAGLPKRWDY
jgi:hypothetical protein